MATDRIQLAQLAERNFNVSLPRLSQPEWRELTRTDPGIARSQQELQTQIEMLLGTRHPRHSGHRPELVAALRHPPEDCRCGEEFASRVFEGLANPNLTPHERAGIESDLAAAIPCLEQRFEAGDHFTLRWTCHSENEADNIDEGVIQMAAGFLEHAWTELTRHFTAPWIAPGQSKIEVVFNDISSEFGGYTCPNGPIVIDSGMARESPGFLQATLAHELFHRIQYAYGLRTRWCPVPERDNWFREGMASWAEVFVWNRVNNADKLTAMFHDPDDHLLSIPEGALPFWLFLQARLRRPPAGLPMVTFFEEYQRSEGRSDVALERTVRELSDEVDTPVIDQFYALFSRGRLTGDWQTIDGGLLYPKICDGAGRRIPNPSLYKIPHVFPQDEVVQRGVYALGADYHVFEFSGMEVSALTLTVTTRGNEKFLFQVLERIRGAFVPDEPLELVPRSELKREIALRRESDAIVLIVSGHEKRGHYDLEYGAH